MSRRACSIPDPDTDTVVVTGGSSAPAAVTRYSWAGWVAELAPLLVPRYRHGCGTFVSGGRRVGGGGAGRGQEGGTVMMLLPRCCW